MSEERLAELADDLLRGFVTWDDVRPTIVLLAAELSRLRAELKGTRQALERWHSLCMTIGQAEKLREELVQAREALRDETTRHHSLRWMLGLETHAGERRIRMAKALDNLRVLYRDSALAASSVSPPEET